VSRPTIARPGHVITLITDDEPEAVQAGLWRPIADGWPEFRAPPRLQILTFERALATDCDALGSAVLATLDGRVQEATLYALLDRLGESHICALLLVSGGCDAESRYGGEGAIVMDRATEPGIIAATLSTLAERQSLIESLMGELSAARRFQGGLRGEIDKIHEELALAASVQKEFLPKSIPQMAGVDVQVLFRPAGYVSGDIYDVQKLDEHHLAFFVADAVGHGVPAALMTMVLARSLTTRLIEPGGTAILPPSEVLRRLNTEMIRRHGESPRFATAVYGVVDCRSREVRIARAGHPAPLVIRGAEVRKLDTDGGLLGVFEDDTFEEVSFTLEPDAFLMIYSDGFETAFPSAGADAYGRRVPTTHFLEQFREAAEQWRRAGLTSAMRTLATKLDAQTGSLHQIDDLTAMVIVPASRRHLDVLFGAEQAADADRPREEVPRRVSEGSVSR